MSEFVKKDSHPFPKFSFGEEELYVRVFYKRLLSNSFILRSSFLHLLVYVILILFETIVYPSFEHYRQNSSTS